MNVGHPQGVMGVSIQYVLFSFLLIFFHRILITCHTKGLKTARSTTAWFGFTPGSCS